MGNKIYYVYKNRDLIFSGDRNAICYKFNLAVKGFYEYTSGRRGLVHGVYKILKEKLPEREKEVDIESDPLEYLKFNLNKNGNTNCSFNPVPYLPDLYDCGLNCRVKMLSKKTGADLSVLGRGPKEGEEIDYYVEVAV